MTPSMRRTMKGPPESAPLSSREILLFETIRKFFDDPAHLDKLRQVLQDKSVSLRRLESIATACSTAADARVCESYYAWLRAYGKKLFDPFARSKHVSFQSIDTTLGQLNFLRWAMSQPRLVERAIHERQARIKRRQVKASEAKSNVMSFTAQTQIQF